MPFAKTVLGVSLMMVVTLSTGCSEFIYDSAQNNHQHRCEKLPPHQYDDCLAQAKQSYKHYQTDREALLKDEVKSQ